MAFSHRLLLVALFILLLGIVILFDSFNGFGRRTSQRRAFSGGERKEESQTDPKSSSHPSLLETLYPPPSAAAVQEAPPLPVVPPDRLRVAGQCQPLHPDPEAVAKLRKTPMCAKNYVSDLVATRYGGKSFLDSLEPSPRANWLVTPEQRASGNFSLDKDIDQSVECRRKEDARVKQLLDHLNRTRRSMNCAYECWRQFEPKVKNIFEKRPQQQHSGKNDNTVRPVNILLSFVLNHGHPEPPFPESRGVLMRTFLETAVPLRDEMHIVVDHWYDGQRFMIKTWRRIHFRRLMRPKLRSQLRATFLAELNICFRVTSSGQKKTDYKCVIRTKQRLDDRLRNMTFDYSNIDKYVAQIRVVDTSPWTDDASTDKTMKTIEGGLPSGTNQPPSNLRVWYFSYYVDHFLPGLLKNMSMRVNYLLQCDARDVFFQRNVFDAMDELPLSSSAGVKADDDEFLFAIEEEMLFFRSGINRVWSRNFFGMDEIVDFEAYNASGVLDKTSFNSLNLANSDTLPPDEWMHVLRLSPDGVPTRVACSGVYGFKARSDGDLTPLAVFLTGFKMILNCGNLSRMDGLDQGAFQVLVHFGLQAANFPVPFVMLSPFTSSLRHMLPYSEAQHWPRRNGKMINCNGVILSLLHQADRHTEIFQPEFRLTKAFARERLGDEFPLLKGFEEEPEPQEAATRPPGDRRLRKQEVDESDVSRHSRGLSTRISQGGWTLGQLLAVVCAGTLMLGSCVGIVAHKFVQQRNQARKRWSLVVSNS